jgi:hypothetical protein
MQTLHVRSGAHSRLLLNRPDQCDPYADPCESRRTPLRPQAAGRGTRVGESGAGRDRGESAALRAGEGASVPPPQPPGRRSGRFLHGLVDQIRRTGRGLLQGGRGQVRVALGHLGVRVPRKRLANYIYPGPVVIVMMSSPFIDISRADYDSELIQKSGQPPGLV